MLFELYMQICYFFYKNITFGLTLFYYEAFTTFSGQTIYNDWYMSLFNVFFTSLPVIALGVFEQDVSSRVCLQVLDFNYVSHVFSTCLCIILEKLALVLLTFYLKTKNYLFK